MKYLVTLNGTTYEVEVEETNAAITAVTAAAPAASSAPAVPAASAPEAQAAAPAAQTAEGDAVAAPMPGNILAVNVKEGQRVQSGEVLMILEAMKMENEIVAPRAGTVKQLLVQKGSVVDTDAVLAVIG